VTRERGRSASRRPSERITTLARSDSGDEPLPATLSFVLTMGALFFVGWLLMFVLLKARF